MRVSIAIIQTHGEMKPTNLSCGPWMMSCKKLSVIRVSGVTKVASLVSGGECFAAD